MRSILLMIFVLASVPFVFRRPLLGIIIYLGFCIVRPEMLFWGGDGGKYIFRFYYCLTIISTLASGNFIRIRQVQQPEFFLMLWLVAAIVASILFSTYPQFDQQYYYTLEIIKAIGMCVLIYVNIKTINEIYVVQNSVIICFTFMGIWGIMQRIYGNFRVEGLGGDNWGDSNGVAGLFVLIFPVVLAKIFTSEKNRDSFISVIIAAIMVILIVCTESRSGMLGLIASVLIFGFASGKILKILKVSLVITLITLPFVPETFLERMMTIKPTNEIDEMDSSAASRLILWKAGLMIFVDNPILGTGFMTFPEAKMKYENQFQYLDNNLHSIVFRTENKKVAHNTYIQLLADCGLLGLLPFVLLVFLIMWKGSRTYRLLPCNEYEMNKRIMYMIGNTAGMGGYFTSIIFMDSLGMGMVFYQIVLFSILSRFTSEKGNFSS